MLPMRLLSDILLSVSIEFQVNSVENDSLELCATVTESQVHSFSDLSQQAH